MEMTSAISDYINKKVLMLNKFFDDADEVLVNVEVGRSSRRHKSGDIFKAEIQITHSGKVYYATVDKDDLYAAIDDVKDEISVQLQKDKKRSVRYLKKGGALMKSMFKGIKDFGENGWSKFKKGRK